MSCALGCGWTCSTGGPPVRRCGGSYDCNCGAPDCNGCLFPICSLAGCYSENCATEICKGDGCSCGNSCMNRNDPCSGVAGYTCGGNYCSCSQRCVEAPNQCGGTKSCDCGGLCAIVVRYARSTYVVHVPVCIIGAEGKLQMWKHVYTR